MYSLTEGEIKEWGRNCPLAPPKILDIYIYILMDFIYAFIFYIITNELYTFHSSNFIKKEKYFLFY